MRRFDTKAGDENGSALILALVFMVAVGLLIGSLGSLSLSNLTSASNLRTERTTEYNGDAAVDGAIQALRAQAPSCTAGTCTCPKYTALQTIDGVVVYCSMGIPAGYYGRIVQFWACPTAAGSTAANCLLPANLLLQAEVVYNDVAPGCTSGATPGCYGSPWGVTLRVVNWDVGRANS